MKSKTGLKFLFRAAMAAFIAAPVLIVSLVGFISYMTYSKKLTADETGAFGLSQTAGIASVIDEYVNFVTSASELDSVKQTAVDPHNEDGTPISVYAENGYNVLDVIVTGADGLILANYSGKDLRMNFFDDNMREISRSETPVSGIFRNNSVYDGKNVFHCVKPVSDIGYVIVVADVRGIYDYLSRAGFMEGGGTLTVFDEAGNAVNADGKEVAPFGDLSGVLKSKIDSYKGKQLNLSGSAKYERFESNGYYGSVGNIAGTKWKWIALYPTSAPVPSPFTTLMPAVVAALVVCLIDVLIMILGTRGLINPLTKTIEKMKVIKDGAFDERLDVAGKGKNEFAQMAEVFNIMLNEVMLSEELHRTISEISDNMLFEWDFVKEKMYLSENFKNTFDISESGAKLINGKFIDSKMDDENADKYRRDINRLLKTKDSVGSEYEIAAKNGGTVWVSLRAHCVTDRVGELVRVLGVLTNIDNEKKLNLQLAEKASYDFLSGLYNRNTFEKELEEVLALSASKKLAVLFVDIDDFKFINDRFNHTIGDEAIKFTAGKLKNVTEKGGLAGRFGGDEFVLCLTDSEQVDDVEQLCVDIIDELYEGYFCEQANTQMNIRVSIGVSLSPQHSSNGKTLIAQADEAMYFVKKNGKSNYHFYDPEDSNINDMINR